MSEKFIKLKSISELHALQNLPKPQNPLISLIDVSQIAVPEAAVGTKVVYDFYIVSLKDKSCGVEYGRNSFDFSEGVMTFSAPGQVYTPTKAIQKGDIQGWMLFFHPDLIRNTHLGSQISDYSFFSYEVFEALHLSETEEKTVSECASNIRREYEQRIDNHSRRVIVSNLELLINYCLRFYERQFNTRTQQSKDIVCRFEKELSAYFDARRHQEHGLPSVQYFAEKSHLSQHYFSDLLKKETGRTPKDHINDFVVEKAKTLLLNSEDSVSQIAYGLGFNYPHYFTRLFKSRTGKTPVEFRRFD
ncbi:MAG: helix-turn-helix transcriptional regulator [Cytophagales bacterium]|nr:helix-turn-helix transcriptional regulator [Cytophagales bacterium]